MDEDADMAEKINELLGAVAALKAYVAHLPGAADVDLEAVRRAGRDTGAGLIGGIHPSTHVNDAWTTFSAWLQRLNRGQTKKGTSLLRTGDYRLLRLSSFTLAAPADLLHLGEAFAMLLVSLHNGVLLLLGGEVEPVGHGSDSEKVLDLLFGISCRNGAFCGLIAVVWLFAPDWQRSGHVGMGCRELACVPDRCPHYCVTLLRA